MDDVADLIADMVRSGVDPDLIGRTAAALADAAIAAQPRRSAGAIRQERYRRHKASQSVTCDGSDAPPSLDKEIPPRTPLKKLNPSLDSHSSAGADIVALASDAFNEIADAAGWQSVRKLSPARRRSLALRLDDVGGLDGWREVLARARGSPFLCGENGNGWRLTFDWLLKPGNLNKVMEGNYDRKPIGNQGRRRPGSGADNLARGLAELVAEKRSHGGREDGASEWRDDTGPAEEAPGGGGTVVDLRTVGDGWR